MRNTALAGSGGAGTTDGGAGGGTGGVVTQPAMDAISSAASR
jgi:hypothetical protein